jgi:hypothetical protein
MFSSRTGSIGGLVNSRTGSGTPVPLASTGMSAYLSKLIPVTYTKSVEVERAVQHLLTTCAPSPTSPYSSFSIVWFL